MTNQFYFSDDVLPPKNMCEPHMPVLLLIDCSGSMYGKDGIPIRSVEKSVNRFMADICKDPKAAERVDVCVIAFNDTPQIIQDWRPITEMGKVELTAGGGTNMSAALKLAVDKLSERCHLYEDNGIDVRMPYLIMLTDGMGDNIDQIAERIRRKTENKNMLPWFLGVPGYDKVTAGKITGGERIFELVQEKGYDFTGFFKVMEVSIRVVSTSAPGEKPQIKDEENPLMKEDCGVRVVKIDDWLT